MAEIVIDRFHVAWGYGDGADTVYKKELKRRKRVLPKAKDAEITGAMWPFRQRPGALDPRAWDLLARLLADSPPIAVAYHLREDRTALFDRAYTTGETTCAIRAWCKRVWQSGLAVFEPFRGTIARWLDAVTHDFHGRQSSGFGGGLQQPRWARCWEPDS